MTNKGDKIKEQVLYYLERNPDGIKVGTLQKLIKVSRNSIYRYLEELESEKLIIKTPSKSWRLKKPIKPQTIPGYQYQAILQGIKEIGGYKWDISTEQGKNNFKELGKKIYSKIKIPDLNLDELKQQTHHLQDIMNYAVKLLTETKTVENFQFIPKVTQNGFPDPVTNLAALITFEGGYIASDPVEGNGFAHYFIITGIIEGFSTIIAEIYGGKMICDIIKIDEIRQIVDIGVFMLFNRDSPYIDPKTGIHYDMKNNFPPNYR